MRVARRSLSARLVLRSFVTIATCFSIACSSSGDSGQPAVDAGADDGASDAGAASDASDGSADPSRNSDPMDMDPTNGDPSLDIAASWIYFDNDQPWVRVAFYASWPPPATLYYWSCSVLLGTVDQPVATYTVQNQNGTQTVSGDGFADNSKLVSATEPMGFRVLLPGAKMPFDHYGLECDVKKTNTGTLAQDTSGSFAVTTKTARTFGP